VSIADQGVVATDTERPTRTRTTAAATTRTRTTAAATGTATGTADSTEGAPLDCMRCTVWRALGSLSRHWRSRIKLSPGRPHHS
jgi:hypothetical protein